MDLYKREEGKVQLHQILFDNESAAQQFAHSIHEKEDIDFSNNSSPYYRCKYSYCPHTTCVNSITSRDGTTRYYIFQIPHVHEFPILKEADNISSLPTQIQLLLCYYAGKCYLDNYLSSSMPTLAYLYKSERKCFENNFVKRLYKVLANDFHCSEEKIRKIYGDLNKHNILQRVLQGIRLTCNPDMFSFPASFCEPVYISRGIKRSRGGEIGGEEGEGEGEEYAVDRMVVKGSQSAVYFYTFLGDISLLRKASLQSILQLLENNPAVHSTGYISTRNKGDIDKAVFVWNDYYIQLDRFLIRDNEGDKSYEYKMIVADAKRGKMSVLTAKSMEEEMNVIDLSAMIEGVIDLDRTGRYWEGEVLNGNPCGYGKEYNDKNTIVYEGFMYEAQRVCFGKEYDGKNLKRQIISYYGGYLNGVRYGVGEIYEFDGNPVYNGNWIDNNMMDTHQTLNLTIKGDGGPDILICMACKELEIKQGESDLFDNVNTTTFYLSSFLTQLQSLTVSNECLTTVRTFELDGLDQLERVEIGERCCRISEEEREDGLFCITNCPNLHVLKIGKGSFVDFKQFSLSGVNSLKSIEFGGNGFKYANFILRDLQALEKVTLKSEDFMKCKLAIFENLNNLHTICYAGSRILQGWYPDGYCKFMCNERFGNQLVIRSRLRLGSKLSGIRNWVDLPLLSSVQCDGSCDWIHMLMDTVILENIPKLTDANINYGANAFHIVAAIRATNANDLKKYVEKSTHFKNYVK